MSNLLSTVDGLLIDVNGVLIDGNEVIPGALETLATLRAREIPFRFMTNSSIYCRYTLMDRLNVLGFQVTLEELYTASYIGASYLRKLGATRYYPLLMPDAQLEFSGIEVDEETPEYVVVGDMGASFTFARLNKAFLALRNGAKLIALHKKRSWRTPEGLTLDAGAFVVALEYAAESKAQVLGKPSPDYFKITLADLGLAANRVANIGEDIEVDVLGAKQSGLRGWLVKSRRFRREDLARGIWPDAVLGGIADIFR
ncbi:MAG: HAD-IIA family hydrolase [Caldilineaceae bacterium]